MQPIKRLLFPLSLLVLLSLACSSTASTGSFATETAIADEIYQSLTANAPANTQEVAGVSAPETTPRPVYSPTPLPKAKVESTELNLRDGPDTSFDVLMSLSFGEDLTVIGQYRECSWLKVQRPSGDIGWVKGGPGFAYYAGGCESIPDGSFRPFNGSIVYDQRVEPGPGVLTVDNGTATDGLVVVAGQDGPPLVAFYLRSQENFKLPGCPDGTYYIYFQTGQGWNGDENRFMLVESIKRIDQAIDFVTTSEGYTTWTLTLANTGTGSVTASDIPENAFPVFH